MWITFTCNLIELVKNAFLVVMVFACSIILIYSFHILILVNSIRRKDESQESDFKDAVEVCLPLIHAAIRDIEKGIFPKSCLLSIEIPTSPSTNKVCFCQLWRLLKFENHSKTITFFFYIVYIFMTFHCLHKNVFFFSFFKLVHLIFPVSLQFLFLPCNLIPLPRVLWELDTLFFNVSSVRWHSYLDMLLLSHLIHWFWSCEVFKITA